MKPKKDGVHYVRVWHRQILFNNLFDISIVLLTTEGSCAIKMGSRPTTLEAGRETLVPNGVDAEFEGSAAHILMIHRA
jgi:hypothetical protein